MKNLINNKGLTLVETLVVTSILGVSAFGLLKATQKTLLTSEIVKTHEDTEELKNSVYTFLNNKEYCINNLLTETNLSNPDGDGVQNITQLMGTSNVLFRVRTDNPTQKPIKDTKGGIQVIDMKLKDKKTFYLYYKYTSQALGDRQKRTDDDCTTDTNGTNKQVQGCYYLSCEMDFSCADSNNCGDDPDDICKPLDCSISNKSLLQVSCGIGEVLTGSNECLGCPEDHFLIGIKIEDDGTKKPECVSVKNEDKCKAHEVAIGTKFKAKEHGVYIYIMDCVDWTCDPGKTRVLRVENEGDPPVSKCEKICHGGQIIKDGKCTCPAFTEIDAGGNCVCVAGRDTDGDGNCVCEGDTKDFGDGSCICNTGSLERNSEGKCYCRVTQCPGEYDCVCKHYLIRGRCSDPDAPLLTQELYNQSLWPPCPSD